MKVLRIVLLVLVLVVALVLLGGFLVFNDWTRGPIPQTDGEITVAMPSAALAAANAGLKDTVEVIRDKWGIPHIYATSTYDLFFAQGYVQAQDRWWQMEFSRHIGSGSIQELTGKQDSVMSQDVFIRTVGWRRAAEGDLENYDEESLAVLQAFADGVNAYILSRSADDLALEYTLLGLTGVRIAIEPWTPIDSLVWAKVMAWNLSGNRGAEQQRSALYETLGQEMADQYLLPWPFGKKPTIIPPEALPITDATLTAPSSGAGIIGVSTRLAGGLTANDVLLRTDPAIGSNNWVVSGQLTESGAPLLADDPHLGIQMPSIWYEIGLHCQPVSEECPFDVRGFALSATPGIIIGHNARIAWGVTNVGPDTQDLYLLKINPDNELQYEWNGEWRDMVVHEETINFGDGEPPITIRVRETHLGPIINDNQIDDDGTLQGFNNDDPMAFRWTALEPSTILKAAVGLNRAQTWEEFREALRYWDVPSQNFVYADVDGNIGYQTPGKIPIRAAGHSGLLPVDGTTDAYEWKGYIPFDDLPRALNPESGFLHSANQAVVPLEYYDQLRDKLADEFGEDSNYFLGQQWDYGYRGQRIVELLQTLAPHNQETFATIHGDNKMINAEELMPFLAELDFGDETLNSARDWLAEWDYQMHMDSPQAALYASFWARLMDNLFNDQLGDYSASGGSLDMWAAYQLAQEPDNAWWDDTRTADTTETRDDILIRSFREGYEAVVKRLGSDRAAWKWGSLHTATFVNDPLGSSGIGLIENIFNRGPVATSGGGSIVNATSWNAASGDFTVGSLPSMRMIVDLSDFSRSLTIHTTGQSGHPYSPHYADMIDEWRNIQYHPMLWAREDVEANAASRLTLKPGG
ncbi:MAG: penicillin acylase family protein [Chloroflexi bacterium]|nr:penicillin acylase family protein [Chloroflexota bacterium]